MAKVVIFGLRDFASLAHFYLRHDSDHEVVAFTVNQSYMPDIPIFEGLPVIPFENLEEKYPPSAYHFLAPMSYNDMNQLRRKIYQQGKDKGYQFISYISSKATTFPGLDVGDNCFILEDNTIQPFTKIGNNVVLWSGNYIGHHSVVKDHAFLAAQVALAGNCVIESSCFIGVNASIAHGLTIAEGCLVAMGASVVHDTEPWGIYQGVPAKKRAGSSKDVEF
jgi:sugar O-acyltransferase (sialic acid O-acetyltransferase NeuD family)